VLCSMHPSRAELVKPETQQMSVCVILGMSQPHMAAGCRWPEMPQLDEDFIKIRSSMHYRIHEVQGVEARASLLQAPRMLASICDDGQA